MANVSSAAKYQLSIDLNNPYDSRVMEINYISRDSCVLDVGCACGDLGIALKEHKNCTCHGFEYNEGSIAIAMDTGAYEKISQVDLDRLTSEDFPEYQGRFDHVVCGDVLEHLREPYRVLDILRSYLKEGGSIVASIPNVAHTSIKANLLLDDFTYTPLGLLDETHIRFFTWKSLADGLSRKGWHVADCKFTCISIQGFQPADPYPLLSDDIKYTIFDDYHSFVCQYVMQIYPSDKSFDELKHLNSLVLDINENTAGDQIVAYRDSVLGSLGERTEMVIARQQNTISILEADIARQQNTISILEADIARQQNTISTLDAERLHLGKLLSGTSTKLAKSIRHKKRYKRAAILLGILVFVMIAHYFWMI